jgi:hypothetical protein
MVWYEMVSAKLMLKWWRQVRLVEGDGVAVEVAE